MKREGGFASSNTSFETFCEGTVPVGTGMSFILDGEVHTFYNVLVKGLRHFAFRILIYRYAIRSSNKDLRTLSYMK